MNANEFYANMPPEYAAHAEKLARFAYDLRQHRNFMLKQLGVPDEETLLDKIRSGEIAEHPAYEQYVSARVMDQTRNAIREDLKQYLLEGGRLENS